jgi:type I restriction enzyme M protein
MHSHAEFQKVPVEARALVDDWFHAHRKPLASIRADTEPSDLIGAISDDLRARFRPVPLVDAYDVGGQVMTCYLPEERKRR